MNANYESFYILFFFLYLLGYLKHHSEKADCISARIFFVIGSNVSNQPPYKVKLICL